MRYTDYDQVYRLAVDILKDDKLMLSTTQELENKLKSLEGSFLDDGFDDVKAFVGNLIKELTNSQAYFEVIASQLSEYANLLKMGKG